MLTYWAEALNYESKPFVLNVALITFIIGLHIDVNPSGYGPFRGFIMYNAKVAAAAVKSFPMKLMRHIMHYYHQLV